MVPSADKGSPPLTAEDVLSRLPCCADVPLAAEQSKAGVKGQCRLSKSVYDKSTYCRTGDDVCVRVLSSTGPAMVIVCDLMPSSTIVETRIWVGSSGRQSYWVAHFTGCQPRHHIPTAGWLVDVFATLLESRSLTDKWALDTMLPERDNILSLSECR